MSCLRVDLAQVDIELRFVSCANNGAPTKIDGVLDVLVPQGQDEAILREMPGIVRVHLKRAAKGVGRLWNPILVKIIQSLRENFFCEIAVHPRPSK